MVNFGEKSSKITVFSDDFLPKLTKVRPKSVSWCSNQEWPSICADAVVLKIVELFNWWSIFDLKLSRSFGS